VIEDKYLSLIDTGSKPDEARSVLPNSLKTEIIMTANLRELRHILKLRTAKESHPEMRKVMNMLLLELQSKIPIIFDDIG
jgi:thymidylate synthase (FAD)